MAVSRSFRVAALALLAGASALGAASAADLLPPPPPPPVEPPPVEIGGGWYLRADFTESYYGRPKDATPLDPNDPGMPPLTRLRMSHTPGYGGGVGYKFNTFLRMDVTIDQRNASRFSTYSSRSNFATGSNIEAGDIDVLTGLFNVYADLGTWWGLTPYVGGGVGFADKGFAKGFTQTTCFLPACDGQPGTGPRDVVARANRSTTSLAWALMGGVSYEIGGGLSLDANYRYINLGRAKSGLDEFGYRSALKDLTAQEVRVGLRYSFAGGPGVFGESSSIGSGLNPYGH